MSGFAYEKRNRIPASVANVERVPTSRIQAGRLTPPDFSPGQACARPGYGLFRFRATNQRAPAPLGRRVCVALQPRKPCGRVWTRLCLEKDAGEPGLWGFYGSSDGRDEATGLERVGRGCIGGSNCLKPAPLTLPYPAAQVSVFVAGAGHCGGSIVIERICRVGERRMGRSLFLHFLVFFRLF